MFFGRKKQRDYLITLLFFSKNRPSNSTEEERKRAMAAMAAQPAELDSKSFGEWISSAEEESLEKELKRLENRSGRKWGGGMIVDILLLKEGFF